MKEIYVDVEKKIKRYMDAQRCTEIIINVYIESKLLPKELRYVRDSHPGEGSVKELNRNIAAQVPNILHRPTVYVKTRVSSGILLKKGRTDFTVYCNKKQFSIPKKNPEVSGLFC